MKMATTTVPVPELPVQVLRPEALNSIDQFWRASCYIAAAMIYLQDNALLHEPLQPEHIKERLLGHWGSSPGLAFIYTHLNRVITEQSLDTLLVTGPGHGAPGILAPMFLEGSYGRVVPDCPTTPKGLLELFRRFSFPGGIGSHCTPEMPGSIHEGGELGYSLSHAVGAAFDNPNLLVACVIGDGEAETGPLAASWQGSRFLHPTRDGFVLPILHLNGYKISTPTLLARLPKEELRALMFGNGWDAIFVEGSEPLDMHQQMAAALDECVRRHRDIRAAASHGPIHHASLPMIVLRSPKGWTGPAELDGHRIEGSWRSHQVPISNPRTNPVHLEALEKWLRSYRPEELFDTAGNIHERYFRLVPPVSRRIALSKHGNGGLLRQPLNSSKLENFAIEVGQPGTSLAGNTTPFGEYLAATLANNPHTFRFFSPDETLSNRLGAVFTSGKRMWLESQLASDLDAGELSADGRVMELLSEHTLEGWLEGYLLTGRHGVFATYEAFANVVTSMINQHCKWLEASTEIPWRADVSSLNLLITSTVWRQDHNGFTHQDPGLVDVIANKSPAVTRVLFPPDANTLLVCMEECLDSTNRVNLVIVDKQMHLQYTSLNEARMLVEKGLDVWSWASNDHDRMPDVVMACCGDVATKETLAATALLRAAVSDIAVRVVNVIDLFGLATYRERPTAVSNFEFASLFTEDRPVIFNFHGYPWVVHRLIYRRPNHDNFHVHGYREHGSITTPLQLAIQNQADRFSLAIAALDRVDRLRHSSSHIRKHFSDLQFRALQYANTHGVDEPETADWVWPSELAVGGAS
jgi:xylulose-5-phosphate/fructose-6-phosphate phosphoketolase